MAGDGDLEGFQELSRHRAGGDPGGSLARTGPFQNVAKIRTFVFGRARKIGMPRPRTGDRRPPVIVGGVGVGGRDPHRLLPVTPVLVVHFERNRATERLAVAHTRQDLGAVGLDRHAPTTSVAALPATHLVSNSVEIERQSGRDAFENHDQPATMGLAGREKSQHVAHIVHEVIAASARHGGALIVSTSVCRDDDAQGEVLARDLMCAGGCR